MGNHPNGRYHATVERRGDGWLVTIAGVPEPMGVFEVVDLDDVEARADKIIWGYRGESPDLVEVDVVVPPALAVRRDLIAGLRDDLERESRDAHRELLDLGLRPLDAVRMLRRWRAAELQLTVTSGEVAARGLIDHPNVTGLVWDDHGRFRTVKCRRCVEDDLSFYRDAPPGEEHALLFDDVDCDFSDEHLDSDLPPNQRSNSMKHDDSAAQWRTSTFSDGLQCVQVAPLADGVAVRNSKDSDSPVLQFTRGEMAAFIEGVKAGEFDDLA